MTHDVVAILLAVFFTYGCITSHEMRKHAKEMTPPLSLVAVCLFLFVALIAVAERPADGRRTGPSKGGSSVTATANTADRTGN